MDFVSVLDNRKWDLNPKDDQEIKENLFDEGYNCWVSKAIRIDNTIIYIYFLYSKETAEVLEENNINFGIFEKHPDGLISKINIPDKIKRDYETDRKKWVQGNFTLISFNEDSYIELFKNFRLWLEKFPNKDVKLLADTFVGSLVQRYQDRIMIAS